MTVSLAADVRMRSFDRVRARRNDDCGAGAVAGDGVIGRLSVIGAIGGELADRDVNVVEDRFHLRGVACVLVGHGVGDDLTTVGIQCQMPVCASCAAIWHRAFPPAIGQRHRFQARCCRRGRGQVLLMERDKFAAVQTIV